MHKLTEKIWQECSYNDKETENNVITEFLKEAAEKCGILVSDSQRFGAIVPKEAFYKILGIESEPKSSASSAINPDPWGDKTKMGGFYQPKDSKTWRCDKHPMGFYNEEWMKYCPLCGKERPKKVEEKSLQNKFRDYYTDNSCYMSRETANELVRLAEIHFTQNPKKFL